MATIIEIIDTLQKLTNAKINQSDIAQALNITRSTVSARVKNNSQLNLNELNKISDYYNVDLSTDKSSVIRGYYYPDVFGSCGNGSFVFSETKELISIPECCFSSPVSKYKHYSVINAVGASMMPYIMDKDRLIVQHLEIGEQIKDNRVYVFCYNNEIFVKRLSKNVNQLIIESDNKIYDTIKLQKDEMNDVIIIGQIVGLMRDCR